MTKLLLPFIFAMAWPVACGASGGDTRPLSEVFSESPVIFYAAVVGSGIGHCGGKKELSSFYIVRVTEPVKGNIEKGDIKACGSAPMLLSNKYLIAGSKRNKGEIVFASDAVLLVFPSKEYYRLISYDGPIVASDRGKAYAVGVHEADFAKRYGEYVSKSDNF